MALFGDISGSFGHAMGILSSTTSRQSTNHGWSKTRLMSLKRTKKVGLG